MTSAERQQVLDALHWMMDAGWQSLNRIRGTDLFGCFPAFGGEAKEEWIRRFDEISPGNCYQHIFDLLPADGSFIRITTLLPY